MGERVHMLLTSLTINLQHPDSRDGFQATVHSDGRLLLCRTSAGARVVSPTTAKVAHGDWDGESCYWHHEEADGDSPPDGYTSDELVYLERALRSLQVQEHNGELVIGGVLP